MSDAPPEHGDAVLGHPPGSPEIGELGKSGEESSVVVLNAIDFSAIPEPDRRGGRFQVGVDCLDQCGRQLGDGHSVTKLICE
jgi:hypothetical protein